MNSFIVLAATLCVFFANTNALYFQYYLSHTQNYLFQYVVTLLHSLYKLIIEGDQLTQKVLT